MEAVGKLVLYVVLLLQLHKLKVTFLFVVPARDVHFRIPNPTGLAPILNRFRVLDSV